MPNKLKISNKQVCDVIESLQMSSEILRTSILSGRHLFLDVNFTSLINSFKTNWQTRKQFEYSKFYFRRNDEFVLKINFVIRSRFQITIFFSASFPEASVSFSFFTKMFSYIVLNSQYEVKNVKEKNKKLLLIILTWYLTLYIWWFYSIAVTRDFVREGYCVFFFLK